MFIYVSIHFDTSQPEMSQKDVGIKVQQVNNVLRMLSIYYFPTYK